MTIELLCLLLTAMLTGVLWIPVVIGYVATRGFPRQADYKAAPTSPLPDWVVRANRAHLNAVENLAPFAVVVLVAHAIGFTTPMTQSCAIIYLCARTAHALIHISGVSVLMARTVAFSVGWAAFGTFAIVLLRHAL